MLLCTALGLVRLHLTRLATLKELLLSPPHPHPPTKNCDFEQQKPLACAWALGAAYLAWEANPDLSNASIQRVFRPLKDQMTCALCQDALVTVRATLERSRAHTKLARGDPKYIRHVGSK
ncbi:putative expressed protein [Lyophyllum shimeji]|uniref:Expressed protein n=1 Tax=Lyophyllum shimeji TaxID=47721 RepID=A0A9P3PXK5_LYOSH|nr:putative expressed protein [Lyophyllum shimeji]